MKKCIKCGVVLIVDENWYESHKKTSNYICKECSRAYNRQRYKDNPVTYPKKIITCKRCGEKKPHQAKGFCSNCYRLEGMSPIVTCVVCGKEKPHHAQGMCYKCYRCKWREANPDYMKQWQEANPDHGYHYRQEYKAEIAIRNQKYYQKNRKKIDARNRAYYQAHRKEIAAYRKERYRTDIQYKLACRLRSRLYKAIKRNYKSGSAVHDLGCSISELVAHLESQFREGMIWDNYGEWEIDHIVPLSSFDLTNREQLLQACHYTNLQPLWAYENSSKGAKTDLFSGVVNVNKMEVVYESL